MTRLLHDGEVVTAARSRRGSVRIGGSQILGVGELTPQPGETVVDCRGCLIFLAASRPIATSISTAGRGW